MTPPDPTNPFVVALDTGPSPRARFRRSLVSLLAVVMLTSVLLTLWFQGRRLFVAHLASDLGGQSDALAQQRLMQLSQLAPEAITPVVETLWHPSDVVGQAAFTVVQQWQQEWPSLPEKTRTQHNEALVSALAKAVPTDNVDGTITRRQIARCEELLRTSLMDHTSDDPNRQVSRTFQRIASIAQSTLSQVTSLQQAGTTQTVDALPGRTTLPVVSADTDTEPNTGNPAQNRIAPPIAAIVARESVRIEPPVAAWTDWPPPTESGRNTVVTSEYQVAADSAPQGSNSSTEGSATTSKVVNLKPVPRGRMPRLLPAPQSAPAQPQPVATGISADRVATNEPGTAGLIKTASHVETNLMHALVDQSVIAHLASKEPATAQMAALELKQRGWSDALVELGRRYANSTTDGRIALVRSVTQSGGYDSQPWLLMMLTDPDRNARLHAVAILSQSDDRYVQLRLRERLDHESDAQVATRLRRVLGLR